MLETLARRIADARGLNVVTLIRRGTLAFLVAVWLVGIAAAAIAVWLLLTRADSQVRATASGLEQYARRNLEIGSFVTEEFSRYLDRVGAERALTGDAAASAEMLHLTEHLPKGSTAVFVNAAGIVTLSASPLPKEPINLSDRRWFQAHVTDGLETYVGPAIRSRVIDRIIYTYSRTYKDRDGRLLGVINLGIPSDSVIGLSPGLSPGTTALVQHEGLMVAARPICDSELAKPVTIPPLKPKGETSWGMASGSLSIESVRDLPDYRLFAIATLPLLTVLKPALWGIAAGLLALAVLSFVLLNLSQLAQKKSREVEQALADNKVLFQEVHHRVKNNLQVISSLIRLQTDRLPKELAPLMEQTAARVRAIALVHEQIYMANKPSEVQLDVFLRKLMEHLGASLIPGEGAGLAIDLEPVTVELDRAVPVALLATEAITNAIKHGSKEDNNPIAVTLRRAQGLAVLQVTNDGSPEDTEGKAGLGRRIMSALAQHIDGRWSLEATGTGRTCFTFAWPA